ncbi:MAG: hypothetical protein AAGA67_01940 [Cyanobacteria bacterium P01_F01_bin.153]
MANCPSPVPIAVQPNWLRTGLAIAAEQSNPTFGKVAMLNHLAMESAQSLLQWLNIPCGYGDRPAVSLWGMLDFSELGVGCAGEESGGQILCRPVVLPEVNPSNVDGAGNGDDNTDADLTNVGLTAANLTCDLPLDLPEETVACVPVGFDESLKRAWIWGYVPVAGFEVGVRGTQAFSFGAVPWRSLEELAADLKRWTRLSQELCRQTDLCDRLSALVGPVPLVSLMARWPRSQEGAIAGASLLTQYWRQNQEPRVTCRPPGKSSENASETVNIEDIDPLNTPFEALVYAEDEDYDDYEVLDESEEVGQQLAGRVRDSSQSSSYRVDAAEPGASAEGAVSDEAISRAHELEAIAQDLDQWFRGMDYPDNSFI